MQAHATEGGSSHRGEVSQDHWFRAVLDEDAARVDTLLGLLVSLMADAEAKGEVCTHPSWLHVWQCIAFQSLLRGILSCMVQAQCPSVMAVEAVKQLIGSTSPVLVSSFPGI